MKKTLKTAVALTILVLSALVLSSCLGFGVPSGPVEEQEWTPSGKEISLAVKGQPANFAIFYEGDENQAYASEFKSAVSGNGFSAPNAVYSLGVVESKLGVLFGKTGNKAAELAGAALEAKLATLGKKDFCWAFAYYDGMLAIAASSAEAYAFAFNDFFEKYSNGSKVSFKDDLSYTGVLTYAELDELLTKQEQAAADAKREENAKLLDDIVGKVEDQRSELSTLKGRWNKYSDTDPLLFLFGTYTKELPASNWGAPHTEPTADEHPRLLITRDMLPNIRASLREENITNSNFLANVDKLIENDAILPPATLQDTNAQVSLANIHNYDAGMLDVIQAKALAYLLYDDPYYGYLAIYYMKNYIMSLDIKQIASDQCRQYGYVMFVAATVYDWCYDLLTDEDKIQFIAGVENCLCQGRNAYEAKMEVGFPPTGQGSVSGHGSEFQILRDYLSFAVAIYDENPSWWANIAGRVYNDYLQVRNYYFQSGMTQQGTGNYIPARHICDLYSGWILKVATGENPYVGMENTTKSALGYEFAPGYIFSDGDGTGDQARSYSYVAMAYITAYLYEDAGMLAQGKYHLGTVPFNGGHGGLVSSTYVALHGLARLDPAEDRYESMDLIQYNGYPLGQYIIREAWADESSAAVFMRIKERSTANHEHCDAGTFEIYYKGMLSSDGGIYFNYGSTHTQYFHQATISHNGLIIFNPQKTKEDSGWYSGGQRKLGGESQNLQAWLENPNMDTGKVTGRQHGYANEEKTLAQYAYIAGDITKAYDPTTVSYVGRRMLTVYTGDEEFPMVFFTYDDISSKSKSSEKRFLLQITSKEAPTIDGDTVITENGEGRLVLTCLSDNIVINGVGGRNDGAYSAAKSQNYLINGKQLEPLQDNLDDGHWGRVEVVYDASSNDATFFNVMYVTDKGNDNMAEIDDIDDDNVVGAVFEDKVAALFVTSRERVSSDISYKISGRSKAVTNYVSGVAEGKWNVTVDGKEIGCFEVTAEGGILVFTAPAGAVVVSPAN